MTHNPSVQEDPRVTMARNLFLAWSSGEADAPAEYFHGDGVLYDIVGGEHVGWSNIRKYFANGVRKWPDLALIPEQYWTSDDGVALTWVMSATVSEEMGSVMGAQHVGKKWFSEGMTWLRIVDGKVAREVDYHSSGAVPISLNSQ